MDQQTDTKAFWSAARALRLGSDAASRAAAGVYILQLACGGASPLRNRALGLLAEMGVAVSATSQQVNSPGVCAGLTETDNRC